MNEGQLHAGAVAPEFTLPDQDGKSRNLAGYRGHWVFLYFYPHDDTPECTEEACAIRDCFPEFKRFGVNIFGISPDDVQGHKRFAEKYHLPFLLLSDVHKKVAASYGAVGENYAFGEREERFMRISFLINLMGEIEKIYDETRPSTQVKKVLADLEQMNEDG
jgi:peroxiredoxin Q/BCP